MARLTMSNEIRRITKALELPQTGKNHELRKYHCQLAVKNMRTEEKQKASHSKNDLLNGGGEVKTSFNTPFF